jgi:hypothetical protein
VEPQQLTKRRRTAGAGELRRPGHLQPTGDGQAARTAAVVVGRGQPRDHLAGEAVRPPAGTHETAGRFPDVSLPTRRA